MDPLDHIKTAPGCPMSWNQMTGDEKGRHCSHCSKTVHNLSALTRSNARTLLASGGGNLCVAFSLTEAGRLVSQPETTFFARGSAWLRGGMAFASGILLAACATPTTTTLPESSPASSTQEPACKTSDEAKMWMGDQGNFFVESPQVPPEKQGTKH